MTDEEFQEYIEECYINLEVKQKKLVDRYQVSRFDNYFYNQVDGTLSFLKGDATELSFRVVFIGSWSPEKESFMWSWGNESMTDLAKSGATRLQELSELTGFGVFSTKLFKCTEEMAHELSACAVEYLGAKGMYISQHGRSHLIMALMEETPIKKMTD